MSASDSNAMEDTTWTTVNGQSGGKRNGKAKYRNHAASSSSSSSSSHSHRSTGAPISLRRRLDEIAEESTTFNSLHVELRQMIVTHLAEMIETQVASMLSTSYCGHLQSQVNTARRAMCQDDAASAVPTTSSSSAASSYRSTADSLPSAAPSQLPRQPFDTVIYGIGRFADFSISALQQLQSQSQAQSPPQLALALASITPAFVRTSIRGLSRSPQLQLACILALHRAQTKTAMDDATSTIAAAPTSSSTSSSPPSISPLHMYDPMLSSLEHAVAARLGIAMIEENEEGARRIRYDPESEQRHVTLFYMPHCPATLYNNVLQANWGCDLEKVMILGNSLRKYVEEAEKVERKKQECAATSAANSSSSSGYLRAPKKKKQSAFAAKLAADPICCSHDDHDQGQQSITDGTSTATSSSSTSAITTTTSLSAASPITSSYPYSALARIGPLLQESIVPNTHPSQTVFNDLNLHYFTLPFSREKAKETREILTRCIVSQHQQQQEESGMNDTIEGMYLAMQIGGEDQRVISSLRMQPPRLTMSDNANDGEIISANISAAIV